MPLTIADRLNRLEDDVSVAGREASFKEDRGFGFDPESYRESMAEHFQAEPELKRLLPKLWDEFNADYRHFFSWSDGALALDFAFARAALAPARSLPANWADNPVNHNPFLQVHAWDAETYILRRNPPASAFLYLLLGAKKAVLIDAGSSAGNSTVESAAKGLIDRNCAFHGLPPLELVVAGASLAGELDLGGRLATILPTPGHSMEGCSVYDDRTQWLLTGDLFFPGRLEVAHWPEFRESIARLVEFTAQHPPTAILGGQIQMSQEPGIDFSPGDAASVKKHDLSLSRPQLLELHELCQSLGGQPQRTVCRDFILVPLSS